MVALGLLVFERLPSSSRPLRALGARQRERDVHVLAYFSVGESFRPVLDRAGSHVDVQLQVVTSVITWKESRDVVSVGWADKCTVGEFNADAAHIRRLSADV